MKQSYLKHFKVNNDKALRVFWKKVLKHIHYLTFQRNSCHGIITPWQVKNMAVLKNVISSKQRIKRFITGAPEMVHQTAFSPLVSGASSATLYTFLWKTISWQGRGGLRGFTPGQAFIELLTAEKANFGTSLMGSGA